MRNGKALNVQLPVVEDGAVPETVQIAETGLWEGHPAGPELVTPNHLKAAKDYFDRHYKANEADLAIDYNHASIAVPTGASKAPAAGWIREMEIRDDELWGSVLWTADAAKAIAAKEYRYLSPVLMFNMPDRVTGDPVPMAIHSIALTNTPFLTELEALNQAPFSKAVNSMEGDSMTLFEIVGKLLGKEPGEIATALGFEPSVADGEVANGLLAHATRLKELEGATLPVVSASIAKMLGVAEDAEEKDVKAAVMRLQAEGAMVPIKAALGLNEAAAAGEITQRINDLQEARKQADATALVDKAVEDGKIAPAQREFFVTNALSDLEATRVAINTMQIVTGAPPSGPVPKGGDTLDAADEHVRRLLGIKKETMLLGRDS